MTLESGSMMTLEMFAKQAYESFLSTNNIRMPWRGETNKDKDGDEKQAKATSSGAVYVSPTSPSIKPQVDISKCGFMHMPPQCWTEDVKKMLARIVIENGLNRSVQLCGFVEALKQDLHYYVVWDHQSHDDNKGALCLIGTEYKDYT
eukprot:CAMPEP_0201594962 /NCGR_PEP_ID=MMETSP0190_2-20130828/192115_1 /ASSEMBLY_ACC=CAM_ASM_000263 /TAXON_ID=37353 /ORGANISM="Rosalina sp." /LENGTH=146 /DNA_ID=CAMNT_0048054769 /DNA_START=590 /DNA_END=1026 /DNA_ORIENTATION=+